MKQLLCSVPIFAGLSQEALELFLEHANWQTVADGDLITREGESNNRMYLLESGAVRIVKHKGLPSEVELAQLRPGEFFGEMCILETLPRSASAEAIGPTTVVGVSSIAFYHLYQKMPEQHSILILNIARDLSRRLRRLDDVFAAHH